MKQAASSTRYRAAAVRRGVLLLLSLAVFPLAQAAEWRSGEVFKDLVESLDCPAEVLNGPFQLDARIRPHRNTLDIHVLSLKGSLDVPEPGLTLRRTVIPILLADTSPDPAKTSLLPIPQKIELRIAASFP